MNEFKEEIELLIPSTEFNSEIEVYYPIGTIEMKYGYSKDNKCIKSGIKFNKVRAFRHKAEIYCTSKDIAAYDKVIVSSDTDWIRELKAIAPPDLANSWVMNHYKIFVDSSGCFEVIAESVKEIPPIYV